MRESYNIKKNPCRRLARPLGPPPGRPPRPAAWPAVWPAPMTRSLARPHGLQLGPPACRPAPFPTLTPSCASRGGGTARGLPCYRRDAGPPTPRNPKMEFRMTIARTTCALGCSHAAVVEAPGHVGPAMQDRAAGLRQAAAGPPPPEGVQAAAGRRDAATQGSAPRREAGRARPSTIGVRAPFDERGGRALRPSRRAHFDKRGAPAPWTSGARVRRGGGQAPSPAGDLKQGLETIG